MAEEHEWDEISAKGVQIWGTVFLNEQHDSRSFWTLNVQSSLSRTYILQQDPI